MTPARALYAAAGSPDPRKSVNVTVAATCHVCGLDTPRGAVRVKDALPSTFTDRHLPRSPASEWVCVPCCWALTGKPPDTLRLWSVVYREDWTDDTPPGNDKAPAWPGVVLTTKGDTAPIYRTLIEPPDCRWFVAVATSGQIHTVPWSRMQRGSGQWSVMVEREPAAATPEAFAAMLYHVATLRELGAPEDEIESGRYSPATIHRVGARAWRAHSEGVGRYAGTALVTLALFCARRDSYADIRTRAALVAGIEDGSGRDEVGVDRPNQSAGLVGARSDGAGDGGGRSRIVESHGLGHGAQAPDRGLQRGQLDLAL